MQISGIMAIKSGVVFVDATSKKIRPGFYNLGKAIVVDHTTIHFVYGQTKRYDEKTNKDVTVLDAARFEDSQAYLTQSQARGLHPLTEAQIEEAISESSIDIRNKSGRTIADWVKTRREPAK